MNSREPQVAYDSDGRAYPAMRTRMRTFGDEQRIRQAAVKRERKAQAIEQLHKAGAR